MHVYLGYHLRTEHFLARVFDLLQHRLKRHRSFDVDALLLEADRVRRDAWCKCRRSLLRDQVRTLQLSQNTFDRARASSACHFDIEMVLMCLSV